MSNNKFDFFGKQLIIYSDGKVPAYSDDLTYSSLFKEIFHRYIVQLEKKESSLLKVFPSKVNEEQLLFLIQQLARYQKKFVIQTKC